MLKKLEIKNLNNRSDILIAFNEDVTILSGPNGCGKTNILKLLWYLASPNVERAIREISFEDAYLLTDEYSLFVSKKKLYAKFQSAILDAEVEARGDSEIALDDSSLSGPRQLLPDFFDYKIEKINQKIRELKGSSLFFPTYRRIEEGSRDSEEFRRLASAVRGLTERVSVDNHRLVSSVSAMDIKRLINDRYAITSKTALDLRDNLLESITKDLRSVEAKATSNPQKLLDCVQVILEKVQNADEDQNTLFLPFNKMQEILTRFVKDKGIKIDSSFAIGEMSTAVDADLLSAGEKQVLSFLAYNAFYEKAPIIIDEPELSLHIDWQRTLLPALLKQGTSNQLIIATHSPFIYANYPEKEIMLSSEVHFEA